MWRTHLLDLLIRNGACERIQLQTPSEAVVLEFDDRGNLTGVEKVPRRTPAIASTVRVDRLDEFA